MTNPFVFVDFNNIAEDGQLRLDCIGTRDDLQRRGIQLEDGLVLDVADGDLYAKIVVRSGRPSPLVSSSSFTLPVARVSSGYPGISTTKIRPFSSNSMATGSTTSGSAANNSMWNPFSIRMVWSDASGL